MLNKVKNMINFIFSKKNKINEFNIFLLFLLNKSKVYIALFYLKFFVNFGKQKTNIFLFLKRCKYFSIKADN